MLFTPQRRVQRLRLGALNKKTLAVASDKVESDMCVFNHGAILLRAASLFVAMVVFAPAFAADCVWQGGAGGTASCALQDCIEDGGLAQCADVEPAPEGGWANIDRAGEDYWTYTVCDEYVPFQHRLIAWCRAIGGTWGADGCENLPSNAIAANVFKSMDGLGDAASDFVRDLHQDAFDCGTDVVSSGWGEEADNRICFTSEPKYVNGIYVADYASITFNGYKTKENNYCGVPFYDAVFFQKQRDVACPAGYNTGTAPDGSVHCFLPPSAMCDVNGIDPATGANNGPGIGGGGFGGNGPNFFPSYNSQPGRPLSGSGNIANKTPGQKTLSADAASGFGNDVWRHNFDKVLLQPANQTHVSMIARRPDGQVLYFDASGRQHAEIGSSQWVLESTNTGWLLKDQPGTVEAYDAGGRLERIDVPGQPSQLMQYDASGRLFAIDVGYQKTINLTYDAEGRIQSAQVPGYPLREFIYGERDQLIAINVGGENVRQFAYEAGNPSLLTAVIGRSGERVLNYEYDEQGRVIATWKGGDAERFEYSYDSASQTTIKDPLGTEREYRFAEHGGAFRLTNLTQPCTSCGSSSKGTSYDANGNITRKVDFDGVVTTYQYDTDRNLEVSRTEAVGTPEQRTITTEWHPSLRVPVRITRPSAQDGVDHVTTMEYNADAQLTRRTETAGALSRSWQYSYTANGQLASVTDPLNNVTRYSYHADDAACVGCRGQLASITTPAPLNHVTQYTQYDAAGRQTEVIDPKGMVTQLDYNDRGWLLEMRTAVGTIHEQTASMSYDAGGNLTRIQSTDGTTLNYEYDDADRLVAITDAKGNRIDFALDAAGNKIDEWVTDPNGELVRARQQQMDVLGRVAESIGGHGERSRTEYDPVDNPIANLDPLLRLQQNQYDALGRLRSQLDPAGGETRFEYNDADQITSVTDATGLTTEYRYDGFGRLIALESPDTGLTTYTYDELDNLLTRTDARGVTLTRDYDAIGRLLSESAGGLSIDYSYDTQRTGELARVQDGAGEQVYTHDVLGRMTEWQQNLSLPGANASLSTQWRYANGRLASMTYPSGRVLAWQYDAHGQPTGLTLDGWPVLEGIEHQPFGPPAAWDWGSGQSLQRVFDRNGRLVRQTVDGVLNTQGPWRETYAYDAMDRLTEAELKDGSTRSYRHDAIGNRTELWQGTVVEAYQYALDSHQLLERNGPEVVSYQYDAVGNLINDGQFQYQYNAFERLVGVNGQGITASYAHNHRGQRVYKNVNGQVTLFAYDQNGQLIGEYTANGTPIRETLWMGNTPVAVVADGTIYPVIADHLNTPRQIVNPQGELVWQWQSTPFGVGEADQDPRASGESFAFPLRFPGQYYDAETGLHYNYFRDYDPGTGRYVQSDPIGLGDGPSTYGYVQGNPLVKFDSLGLQATSTRRTDRYPTLAPGRPVIGYCPKERLVFKGLQWEKQGQRSNEQMLADGWRNVGGGDNWAKMDYVVEQPACELMPFDPDACYGKGCPEKVDQCIAEAQSKAVAVSGAVASIAGGAAAYSGGTLLPPIAIGCGVFATGVSLHYLSAVVYCTAKHRDE
jgi:RHS repeat-associated protein